MPKKETEEGELIDQRVPFTTTVSQLEEIDQWRREQVVLISRAEAIRHLIEVGLQHSRRGERRTKR